MFGNVIWYLLIGAIAGWLAGKLVSGHGFGVWVDMIVGVVGALIGGSLLSLLGMNAYGLIGQLITSTIGAVVLLWLVRMFSPSHNKA
ncbi:MAG: Transglycosylase associated protein [Firmicutes bacterium]|nr:Transglycosylase associated protein [Bacillota bacterium]